MKHKKIAAVLAVSMMLFMSACGSNISPKGPETLVSALEDAGFGKAEDKGFFDSVKSYREVSRGSDKKDEDAMKALKLMFRGDIDSAVIASNRSGFKNDMTCIYVKLKDQKKAGEFFKDEVYDEIPEILDGHMIENLDVIHEEDLSSKSGYLKISGTMEVSNPLTEFLGGLGKTMSGGTGKGGDLSAILGLFTGGDKGSLMDLIPKNDKEDKEEKDDKDEKKDGKSFDSKDAEKYLGLIMGALEGMDTSETKDVNIEICYAGDEILFMSTSGDKNAIKDAEKILEIMEYPTMKIEKETRSGK